ncbi:hypothetical protein AN958_01303 [Leucoagaricus sp. SymC.cos]|nr:hypothetical protein AN958_01303 [Leucoagaricus sp. SymC.cos]
MTTATSSLVDHLAQFSSSLSPYVSDALKSSNPTRGLVTASVFYLVVARVLRFKRHKEIHRTYQKKYEDRTLTPEEAQKVMLVSSGYDMPLLLNCSLAFVLFKTYGLPSISKLLSATKQLKSSETVSRRYADTEVMISTWVGCPISGYVTEDKSGELDPRAMIALARVNYLHSKYNISNGDFLYTLILFAVEPATWARRLMISTWVGCPISGYVTEDKSGELDPRAMIALARVNYLHSKYNISNGDFLYTLILFAVEPATWARRYGWRALSPLEEYAYCIFWVEIGKRMGIKDIPETPEAMRAWAKAYEEEYMVSDPINKEVADYTTEELLYAVPTAFGIRDWFEGLIVCMLDDTAYEEEYIVSDPINKEMADYTTEELLYAVPTAFGIRDWFEGLTACMLDDTVRKAMMKPEQPLYKHLIIWSILKSTAFAYEEEYIVSDPINKEMADYTTEELLYAVPTAFGIRDWFEGLTVCMLDDTVRKAMMKPEQPLYKHLIVWSILKSTAFVQKWLMLPRSDSNYRFPIKLELTRKADGSINPRMHPNKFAVRPWYRPEATTFLGNVWDRFLVLTKWHSHMPSPTLHSDGYRLEEMGPIPTEKLGNAVVLQAASELLGCPITGAFAR